MRLVRPRVKNEKRDADHSDCRNSAPKKPALIPSGWPGFRQAVSGAANRFDFKGAARFGNASEDQDRAVDDILTDNPSVPAGRDQLFASDDLTLAPSKRQQYLHRLRFEVLRLSIEADFTRLRIGKKSPEAKGSTFGQVDLDGTHEVAQSMSSAPAGLQSYHKLMQKSGFLHRLPRGPSLQVQACHRSDGL